ncbi:MAG: ABC transporter substrate-binding protein, partial [Alphaproteobacteria bacterium]
WIGITAGPSERFLFERNPYFHRVDPEGRQLPYVDRWVMQIADSKIIPAMTGTGQSTLQARYLRFDNFAFLRQNAERAGYKVHGWRIARGAHLALFPNLNATDPVWRGLLRDVRFRRALSLAIHRRELNRVLYFGQAVESQNTVLAGSPLYRPEYQSAYAAFAPEEASRLLDEIGLTKRDGRGVRLLPDGRPLVIVIETAGESTEESDALQLVHDSWLEVGVKLVTKPSHRDVLRNRIFAGETLMSISAGLENGLATADQSPQELAPTSQVQYQWPKWGQYFETGGQVGEAPDMPPAARLLALFEAWRRAPDKASRTGLWHEMLAIHADQLFTIGLVTGVLQPVVAGRALRNVPAEGVYNWDPGAHFGIYETDTFWLDTAANAAPK